MAARNLVRLWIKTGEEKYAKEAERTFQALAMPLKNNPAGLPALADALALYLDAKEEEVRGERGGVSPTDCALPSYLRTQ